MPMLAYLLPFAPLIFSTPHDCCLVSALDGNWQGLSPTSLSLKMLCSKLVNSFTKASSSSKSLPCACRGMFKGVMSTAALLSCFTGRQHHKLCRTRLWPGEHPPWVRATSLLFSIKLLCVQHQLRWGLLMSICLSLLFEGRHHPAERVSVQLTAMVCEATPDIPGSSPFLIRLCVCQSKYFYNFVQHGSI